MMPSMMNMQQTQQKVPEVLFIGQKYSSMSIKKGNLAYIGEELIYSSNTGSVLSSNFTATYGS